MDTVSDRLKKKISFYLGNAGFPPMTEHMFDFLYHCEVGCTGLGYYFKEIDDEKWIAWKRAIPEDSFGENVLWNPNEQAIIKLLSEVPDHIVRKYIRDTLDEFVSEFNQSGTNVTAVDKDMLFSLNDEEEIMSLHKAFILGA